MAKALGVAPKFNSSKLAAQVRTTTSAFFLTTWLHLFLSDFDMGSNDRDGIMRVRQQMMLEAVIHNFHLIL